jgi:hypothetical protein
VPLTPYEYATLRVVPRLERGEFINAGVVVYAPTVDFLRCRVAVHRSRLLALAPGVDVDTIVAHVEGFSAVCHAACDGGAVAGMPLRERFHWLVHPKSASLQFSPVHTGLSDDLGATLERLFERLVSV